MSNRAEDELTVKGVTQGRTLYYERVYRDVLKSSHRRDAILWLRKFSEWALEDLVIQLLILKWIPGESMTGWVFAGYHAIFSGDSMYVD